MSKPKYIIRCQECGHLSPRWMGKCPECGQWNSMVEEKAEVKRSKQTMIAEQPQQLSEVSDLPEKRHSTSIHELDRVLGGGLVSGAVVLVGGEPGIGKSTLLLQLCNKVGNTLGRTLLVSGEESIRQIRMRANRLGALSENTYIISETNMELIEQHIENSKPALLVIDSIQTVFNPDIPSAAGSISQVR
jgi:DNA repair protein RadA/Sms